MNLEFNVAAKDLAVVEVLQQVAKKTFVEGFDSIHEELKGIDIEVEAIKQPLNMVTKKLQEVGENINGDIEIWGQRLEDKKAEILKSEEDFTEYEGALALANANVNEDIQSRSVAAAKAKNTMRL